MANSGWDISRVVFDFEPELTQVYMAIRAYGDSPLGVEGWHHKTFPKSMSMKDICDAWATDPNFESPVMWPLKAPGNSPGRDPNLVEQYEGRGS